ncbi:zinc finger CCCH domain-containing protein 18 isoform X1 [Selaginella moellendorffii]|uniref:zinc finger CCCH domain-containing protein 18 isoform X1 n=1 Tax=Selaginella moellendorffii TaxID=88036 RepID=UPI000D1CB843|nr:zinc finger CCCH domain-containing protein 18 isoform X1 [Selaginella moellendorffii]|eukprot:XP_024544915.1 zinc finger CCCH domain-containing protein 18 isoform X1 [Selaginella moellendorffii]
MGASNAQAQAQQHQNGGNNKGSSNISHNNSSSESEDWGEEPWTVDCPCGVTFDDGEEMVECDECGVWVHTSCCQVSKSVSTYVCDKCKEKKRKEREESEVAQLLVELPGKSVSFDERNLGRIMNTDTAVGQSCEVPVPRKVHEHGAPGGDASIFVGVSSVFSQQLWKCAGYVPKLLHVQYTEIPNWHYEARTETACLFELCKPALKESPPSRGCKKVKAEHQECKLSNVDGDVQPVGDDEGGGRRDRHGKKLEVIRHTKHKYKFRGLKDDKQQHNSQSKRTREDVKEQHYSRKKMKAGLDSCKGDQHHRKAQSPKNPKAMKKNAVQEFMDGNLRLCSKCLRPEPSSSDEQGNASKQFVCVDCQKPRLSTKKQDTEGPPPQREDQCKKLKSDPTNSSQNVSPITASTELPKQALDSSLELPSPEVESVDHSSLVKQQQAGKPPHGVDDTKKLEHKGCQLSVRTTFSKSDIPSPASINSGGPSVKSFGENATPSSPTNQKPAAAVKASHLPPPASAAKTAMKSSAQSTKSSTSSKQTVVAPASLALKKSDSAKSSNVPLKSPSSQPSSSKQLTTSKTPLAHTSSKPSHGSSTLPRKSGSKDGGDRTKDDKGSLFKSSGSSPGASSPAAPLNDEELALLLHQELNSSPRVPRVPRVRQAVSSASAQPSNILTKRTLGSSSSSKEHRLMWRKRHREESCRGNSSRFSETPHLRRHDEGTKTDDEAASSRADSPELSEGGGGENTQHNEAGTASSKKHIADADETSQGGGGDKVASEAAAFVSPRQRG